MATIEELDFQLIIDDSQFNQKIDEVKVAAQKLNTQLSALLSVKAAAGGFSSDDLQNMEKMNALLEQRNKTESKLNNRRKKRIELEREITAELQRQAKTAGEVPQTVNIYEDHSKTINNMRAAQEGFNKEVQKSSKLWTQLKNLTTAYFSVMGATRLISNLVRVSAEFEKQRISLEAILKDVSGADQIFEQIKGLAVMSPFTFKELVTYTKQLSAFSVPMGELYDTTKMLADVSAGLGVGMDRLILAYGQIRSASFLRGQEVRQLTEAGVPILKELSQQLTELEGHFVSVGEVFDKISARQVTFEMVEKVFKGMTEEGGKFYQMQEVLAETLSGKISNLKDAYQIMFAEIGEKSNGILVKSVDALRSLATNYEEVGRKLLEIIAIYGVYKAAVPVQQFIELVRYQTALARGAKVAQPAIEGLAEAIDIQTAAMVKNNAAAKLNIYALMAAAVVALGFAVYELARKLDDYGKVQKIVNEQTNKFIAEVQNEEIKLSFLFKQLQNAEKGTAEYEAAKKKILNTYDQYLSDIDRENLALGKQVEVYQKLKVAIREAVAQKAMEEGMTDIGKVLQSSTESIMGQFDSFVKLYSNKTNTKVADAVWDQIGAYIRGEIDKDAFTKEGRELYDSVMDGIEQAQKAAKGGKRAATDWMIYGNLDALRANYERAGQIAEDGMESLQIQMNRLYGPLFSKGEEAPVLKEWAKDIQAIIDEAAKEQITINLKVDENSTLATVVDDIRTNIEDATKSYEIAQGIEEGTAEIEKKRLGYLERINAVVDYKGTPGGSGGGGATQDTAKERVREIKAEIDAYKTLKEAYQSLIEYMDDTAARNAIRGMAGVFGLDADADFDAEINRLIFELGNLGEAGADAAQSLLQSFAMEAFKKYQEEVKAAADATKEFEEMLKDMDDVFSLAGFSGVSLDIAKIGKSYRDAVAKIAEERAKAVESLDREALNRNMTDSEYEEYLNKIFGFFDIQEANERTEAVDKVRDKIEQYYKERRDLLVDFTNLSQKSLGQLEDMKDKIISIVMNGLDEGIVAALEGTEFSAGQVEEILKRLVSFDLSKLDQESNKLIAKKWGKAADEISDLGESIKEVGEAGENTTLSNFGDMLIKTGEIVKWYTSLLEELGQIELSEEMSDSVKALAESRSVVQAFISFALSAISQVLHNIAETQKKLAQAREEIRNILTEGYLDSIRDKVEATSTLFGESFLGKVRAVNTAIRTLKGDIDDIFRSTGGGTKGGLLDLLQTFSQAAGIKLFDDNGGVNLDLLKILEEGAKGGDFFSSAVVGQYSTELKNLEGLSEELQEMLQELDSTVGELFSNMGESITDELIDKLNQTGEVVADLEGVFQSLGDTIMKSLIQSVVVDEILSKYEQQVKSWFTTDMSADQMAAEMDTFADNVRADVEAAGDKIKSIYDAFKSRDLITGGEASESGLTNGIKGVTEETASLLASYINAIRADVAYNRLQLEDVRGDVRMMVGLLPSTPTLAEYLTQIQANTFNTAARTEAILLHLEELTTAEGGAAALRVFM